GTVTVLADGGVVNSTLTITIPDGVDLDTEIDIEAASEAGVNRFVAARERPSWWRRHTRHLVAAAVIAVIVAGTLVSESAVGRHDEPVVASTTMTPTPPATTTASTSRTTTSATTPRSTTVPKSTTEPIHPAKLVVRGPSEQEITSPVGNPPRHAM